MVEAMITQLGAFQRLLPEVLVQVLLEQSLESGIRFCCESRARTDEQGAKRRRQIQRCQFFHTRLRRHDSFTTVSGSVPSQTSRHVKFPPLREVADKRA